MPNANYNDQTKNSQPAKNSKSGTKGSVSEGKGINWPGLPGKSGPDRSAGVKKVKTTTKSQGI